MDNLISGLIAAAIFIPFVGGLAVSIGVVPFAVIVIIVVAMLLFDFSNRRGTACGRKRISNNDNRQRRQ